MKVVAVMMVRNEDDILGLNIAHHFALGVDEFRIVDNGSSDETPRALRRMGRADRRILHTRDDGPYRQSEITTELAREATRGGADWILVIDADELWASDRRPLKSVLAASGAGALAAPVVTLVQRRSQLRNSRRALLSMTHRAVPPSPSYSHSRRLVRTGRIAFVELPYPPKLVHRATRSLVIHAGNHGADGSAGSVDVTGELVCLHAPLRSREALDDKANTGRRVSEAGAGFFGGDGWHVKRWSEMTGTGPLDAEWAANSHEEGQLEVDGERRSLVVDTRLRDAALRAARSRWWPFGR